MPVCILAALLWVLKVLQVEKKVKRVGEVKVRYRRNQTVAVQ